MSVAEVCWRVGRVVSNRMPSRTDTDPAAAVPDDVWGDAFAGFRVAQGRPVLLDRERALRMRAEHPDAVADLLAAADLVVARRFTYFGYPTVELAEPIDWHHDAVAGVDWPRRPSHGIDYRTAGADVKWIWELNRLQHLPWLAQAWSITGDARYAEVAFAHLDTWIEQNPPGMGIAWRNAFEAGVRSISIALALQGFRDCDDLTEARFRRIGALLVESAHRCWAERSRFSSANNHLVGELAGLAVIAILFPDLPGAAEWERDAVAELTNQAPRQILADGAGAEQAVGYQMFTVELMLVVVALLVARDGRAPAGLVAAIDRSSAYLAALVGDSDPDPRYGDDDEGFALRLGPEATRTVRDHLGIVAAATGRPIVQWAGNWTPTAGWYAGMRTAAAHDADAAVDTTLRTSGGAHHAPEGGLVVLRARDRRVTMDVAPLGFLSIAAHGHADALAVTLAVDGADVIGDPGAASYYGHPDWRRVHRGTRVHGCVEVDGLDQSVIAGPFMWSKRAEVRCHAIDLESGIVDAEHDGYRRLPDPVTHRRWLVAPPDGNGLLVVDLISGPGTHGVRTSWPLHPSIDVEPEPQGHRLTRGGTPLLHVATAGTAPLVVEQVRGCERTHLGWWSDRLESREPAWLVGASGTVELPVVLATFMTPAADGAGATDLEVSYGGGQIDVAWHLAGREHRAVVDTTRFGRVDLHPSPRSDDSPSR
jgi:hypothetical protein